MLSSAHSASDTLKILQQVQSYIPSHRYERDMVVQGVQLMCLRFLAVNGNIPLSLLLVHFSARGNSHVFELILPKHCHQP